MDLASLIPTPDTIPAHWGWFQFFLMLTFFLHLLFMNVMLGSGIIILINEIFTPALPSPIYRDMGRKLPTVIAFAVNFGVAPLLFLQVLYGQFMYTSSVLMAVWWLSVVGALIISYACAYFHAFRFDILGKNRPKVMGLAVFLLLAISFIFSNNMTLMLRPDFWPAYFDNPTGWLLNLQDPTLLPRWLHFVTASLAVGGLFIAILGKFDQTNAGEKKINLGFNWFSSATMVQIMIGIWFLFSLPVDIRHLFLGGNAFHTLLLLTAATTALLALGSSLLRRFWLTMVSTGSTIFLMILMRDLVRRAFLAPYFSPVDLQVKPEYSPMIVFILSLLIGGAFIAYMLRLAFRTYKEVPK